MKLILTSSEFKIKEIIDAIVNFTGKSLNEVNVAVINEASAVEKGDKRWLIEGLYKLSKFFGGEIDIINLLALNRDELLSRIKQNDVIFCFGGNAEWLKIVFDKKGFSELLPSLLEEKVWIGSSAGSMILGKMPSEESQSYLYDIDDFNGVSEYLGLVNFSILPHIFGGKENDFEVCVRESEKQDYPVYVLSDNSALIVDDKKTYLVGQKGFKLVGGKVIEKV